MIVPQFIYGDINELQRYFALLVQQMQIALSDDGFTIPNLTQTEVNEIVDPGFDPVMPRGTLWFNVDEAPNGKLQFITIQAIPDGFPGGPLTATYETITSA